MKKEFTLKLEVPSLSKEFRFTELYMHEYKVLMKFVLNRDIQGFDDLCIRLLKEKCEDKTITLNCFDRTILMLELYSICVKNEIKFKSDTNNATYTIFIDKIIKKFTDLKYKKTIEYDNFSIELSFPVKYFRDDLFDTISSITMNGNKISLYNEEYKKQILGILPSNITNEIKKWDFELESIFEDVKIKGLEFDFKNTASFLSLLLFFYRGDIKHYYDIIYMLGSTAHLSAEYLESLTYAEVFVLVLIYKEQQAQQEEEKEKQQNNKLRF